MSWLCTSPRALAGIAIFLRAEHPALRLLGLCISTLGSVGVDTNTHTATHFAASHSRLLNEALAYFGYPFFLQLSLSYWRHQHIVVHHPNPNVSGLDDDADFTPFFASTDRELAAGAGFFQRHVGHQWIVFLRNAQNLSDDERVSFDELCRMQLPVTRAWGLKELFDDLCTYRSEAWARRFFQKSCFRATHSQLPPVAKVAWMLKERFEDVVTYVKHRITDAVAEGLNSKTQALKSAARGFRNVQNYRTAILFHSGSLNLLPNS